MIQSKAAPEAQPVLIKVNEFCRLYGVKRTRAYEMFSDGSIRTVLIGRSRLVLVESAEEFVAASLEASRVVEAEFAVRACPRRPAGVGVR